ncbi:MAG TPA: hypothetical protein K8V95_07320 [Staphylococcus arlettae]|nr:hypothetical protein [Staphylococcus arlettae]
MILQVNKKKQEDKDVFQSINLIFESKVEELIKQEKQSTFSSKSFGRKSGKTTLITRLAKKYDLPIVVSHNVEKEHIKNNNINRDNIYSMDKDFGEFHGSNITLVLVDNITERDVLGLNNAGISVIGFVNYKQNNDNKTHEDYLEISSIEQNEHFITAHTGFGEVVLSKDKQFKSSNDGFYNQNNLNAEIDSVYLLDNTGKTIKKIM